MNNISGLLLSLPTRIKPETRMLLVRMLTNYDVEDEISVGVRALSHSLGVSNKVVTEGVKEMCQAQLMMRDYNMGTKGRPKYFYVFFPKLKGLLNHTEAKAVKPIHQNLIDQLLQPDRAPKLKEKQHPLKISNRLLLIALLQHASGTGVVSSFSKAELQKILGISSDRLKSQLMSLMKHGYIRSYTPGLNSKTLFGASKGIYYLNLMHPNFREQKAKGKLFIVPSEAGSSRKELVRLSDAIHMVFRKEEEWVEVKSREYKRRLLKYVTLSRDVQGGIEVFFPRKHIELDVENYFQAKIDGYASYLLNHHWSGSAFKECFDCHDLRKLIGKEVINEKYCLSLGVDQRVQDLVTKVIFDLSLRIASQVQYLIQQQEGFNHAEWSYSIVPASNLGVPGHEPSHLVVELYERGEAGYREEASLLPSVVKSKFKSPGFAFEDELDDEKRYIFGLLTRPKPYHNQSV